MTDSYRIDTTNEATGAAVAHHIIRDAEGVVTAWERVCFLSRHHSGGWVTSRTGLAVFDTASEAVMAAALEDAR